MICHKCKEFEINENSLLVSKQVLPNGHTVKISIDPKWCDICLHLSILLSNGLIFREEYGNNLDILPNDHCNWVGSFFDNNGSWQENDSHLRERVKILINEKAKYERVD